MTPQDPIQAVTHPKTYEFYQELSQQPFTYHPILKCWVAANAKAVKQILTGDHYKVRPADEAVPYSLQRSQAGIIFSQLVRMRDDHTQVQLKRAFCTALNAVSHQEIQQVANEGAALLLKQKSPTHMAFDLPIWTIGRLLGFKIKKLSSLVNLLQIFSGCISLKEPSKSNKQAASELWSMMQEHLLNKLPIPIHE